MPAASPEIIASNLPARERIVLLCVATGTDWGAVGISEATAQHLIVMDLIERPRPRGSYVLTKLGREVLAALLERAGIKLARGDRDIDRPLPPDTGHNQVLKRGSRLRRSTMIRILVIGILAIATLTSASAQQASLSADQKSQIETFIQKLGDGLNKRDQAVLSMFTENAIFVNPFALRQGRSQLQDALREGEQLRIEQLKLVPVLIEPEGSDYVLAISDYTAMVAGNPVSGRNVLLLERNASEWRVRLAAWARKLSPPSTSSK
jgi:ketosteroid isomerase-like protein